MYLQVQVLSKLKSKSEIRVLDDVIRIAPRLLSQIIKMVHVDIPPNSHIFARAILKLGLGITGGVCLGWADTKGFHMVGCRGSVSAAASIGGDIMAGLHHSRKYVKAILGISNVCVELVFELPEKAAGGVAGTEGEQATPEKIEEVIAQGDEQRDELGVDKPESKPADLPPDVRSEADVPPEDTAEGAHGAGL